MDIQNATAAGPSRGLLDVLFGTSKDAEEPKADGQGFESLMNFIKGMNDEKKEEQNAGLGRTLRETTPGKNVADSNVVGMPGLESRAAATDAEGQLALALALEQKEQQEKLQALSLMLGVPVQGQPQPLMQAPPSPMPAGAELAKQAPIPAMKLESVNAVLKQKELPPLSSEELKLLQAVNSKLAQVQAPKHSEVPKALAAGAGAVAAEQNVDPRLLQEMAKKGIDPKKLKGADASASSVSGTPEKMVSTESYMQMQESVGKASAKEATGKGTQAANAEAPLPQSAAQGALTSAAVAGASAKGLELGSKKERDLELPEGAKQNKLDAAGGPFGAALAQQSKEISQHELNLSGMEKPDQFREALMTEVGSGVSHTALKGGGEMRLVINPGEMGEVKLKISTKNGKVDVQVSADNSDVANVLRGGSKDLEASLKEQNLTLSKFEVSVTDTSSVASLDTKTSLNEQFLSQNQQNQSGYGQGDNEGRNNRWDSHQNNRQGGSYASLTEENERSSPKSANPLHKQPVRNSSRRLDISA